MNIDINPIQVAVAFIGNVITALPMLTFVLNVITAVSLDVIRVTEKAQCHPPHPPPLHYQNITTNHANKTNYHGWRAEQSIRWVGGGREKN